VTFGPIQLTLRAKAGTVTGLRLPRHRCHTFRAEIGFSRGIPVDQSNDRKEYPDYAHPKLLFCAALSSLRSDAEPKCRSHESGDVLLAHYPTTLQCLKSALIEILGTDTSTTDVSS